MAPHFQASRRTRQRGVTMLVFTVGLVAVLGMAGLALDLGVVYLERTRIQNAVDAAAMSGAKTLNTEFSTASATGAALAAFELNRGALTGVPTVEFSATLSPFVPGTPNPKFVRVTAGPMPVGLRLLQVLPGVGNALAVVGTAVAGPMYLGEEQCGAVPILLCGVAGDSDCSDGICYGLGQGVGTESTFTGKDNNLGPGNYGFVVLSCGTGANCLRHGLAGGESVCFTAGGVLPTEPGLNAGGASQGLNTRFGIYQGPVDPVRYPPDKVTAHDPRIFYSTYQQRLASPGTWDHPNDGVANRRILLLPVGDCAGPMNGRTDVTIIGSACALLTTPMDGASKGAITGELIGTCPAQGGPPPDPPTSGAFVIVLYQNPGGS